jgi:hypothetical protein
VWYNVPENKIKEMEKTTRKNSMPIKSCDRDGGPGSPNFLDFGCKWLEQAKIKEIGSHPNQSQLFIGM